MILTEKGILKIITVILVVISLFTLAQAYYSAYIHIALIVVCFFICRKEQWETLSFIVCGIGVCLFFVLMSFFKNNNAFMEHVGFYLHYITWPFLFVCIAKKCKAKEINHLLYFIIGICIIGDILTLIQLNINPDISRLLAGTHLGDEKLQYYKMGVGGYGYVFAMSFFMYGIVRWIKKSTSKAEKIYLIVFLIINSLLILYAAYTTAIIISVALIGLALMADIKLKYQIPILSAIIILMLVLGNPLLEACYDIANNLELNWVAKRFEQLLQAQETNDMSSLRRVELYTISWNTFKKNPITGGSAVGGHSQILDLLAQYGIFAVFMPMFLFSCKLLCNKILGKSKLTMLFLTFIVFACIDTCSVMQIPVIVFFAVPLILYLDKEGGKI